MFPLMVLGFHQAEHLGGWIFLFLSLFLMPFGKHQARCHVSCDSLTLLSFSSPASGGARDPEEESSQLLSERRRGGFYHREELPQRNQSDFPGEHCRCCSRLSVIRVSLVVSQCDRCGCGSLHVNLHIFICR